MVDSDRTWCGTNTDHVSHPVGHGAHAFRCEGYGKYHDRMRLNALSDRPCGTTWTGPTGVVWDCDLPEHPTDPTRGYCGSGHSLVARPKVGA